MANWQLRKDNEPKGMLSFPRLLYAQPEYLSLSPQTEGLHFWAEHEGMCTAHVAFEIIDKKAISLQHAPFGGLVTASGINEQDLRQWWQKLERALFEKGVEEVLMHQPPAIYGDDHMDFYTNAGFHQLSKRIYHAISIPSQASWFSLASTMEQRKWKKCEKAGAEWLEVQGQDRIKVIKKLIEWRKAVEQPASLNLSQIEKAWTTLPNNYHVFGVMLRGEWVAATLAVRASEEVLYHFLPGSHPDFKTYSPMVFLVEGMYRKGIEWGLGWIDLGASEVNGVSKTSLAHFKEQIGGQPWHAYSWKKIVN